MAAEYGDPRRLSFPDAEARHGWLPPLLDAYHTTDRGVHAAIHQAEAEGRRLACAKGCATCCTTHADIPVYPLELIGLYWYATEQLQGPLRPRLIKRLHDYRPEQGCPFLLDGACAVHALRPMACRQFNVFDRPCRAGEDAFHTRRGDVMTPLQEYTDAAFDIMLPFYGVHDAAARKRALEQGLVHTMAKVLQSLDWRKLAERMAAADAAGG